MNRRTFGLQVIGGFAAFRQQNRTMPKSYTRAEVASKVKQIVIEQLKLDESEVVREARFVEDLKVDSLDTVELLSAFEEGFDIEIPDEECEAAKTVGSVMAMIEKRLRAAGRLIESQASK